MPDVDPESFYGFSDAPWHRYGSAGTGIASVHGDPIANVNTGGATFDGNAALIEAAPQLLTEIKRLTNVLAQTTRLTHQLSEECVERSNHELVLERDLSLITAQKDAAFDALREANDHVSTLMQERSDHWNGAASNLGKYGFLTWWVTESERPDSDLAKSILASQDERVRDAAIRNIAEEAFLLGREGLMSINRDLVRDHNALLREGARQDRRIEVMAAALTALVEDHEQTLDSLIGDWPEERQAEYKHRHPLFEQARAALAYDGMGEP